MTRNFGKPNAHTAEIGRNTVTQRDVDSDKYRITCLHVHIFGLAVAMVGVALHLIMTYEDIKRAKYYQIARHIPCALLLALVVAGNRLYKPLLYQFYLIFNFLFVAYSILASAFRQYRLRTDPTLKAQPRHSVYFFAGLWAAVIFFEVLVYYVIYRDYRFVKDVQQNPPAKVQSIRHRDRTIDAPPRY